MQTNQPSDRESHDTSAPLNANQSTSKRFWQLADCNLADIRAIDWEVAILPMGATEPHNLHLPYATDTLQVEEIANQLAKNAWDAGAKILVLPTVPYGTETNLQKFPFAMNLAPKTVFAVMSDLLESLERGGIRKLMILNGHGGNEFKPWLREIYGQTSVHVFLCNWFTVLKDVSTQLFQFPDDHAGEMETSLVMALRPDLVARTDTGELAADAGSVARSRFEAVERGWVGITRPWHLLTTNSGSGNPHQATSEKGNKTLEMLSERIVPFLVQLAKSPLDSCFPFEEDRSRNGSKT